uniref:FAD dependent oxidoreductase domain-containing protein n=1 Tax=Chromera velia CCMP2878 TaxID=1169474 RepID=A0A0G4FE66_9ALVE|eukprot:Cvel_16554.t1-p1 / transcript=Cvel_16554.t1 / gene=Cvel_16554 / organism=Chromera_velia_CCMP2878 / gene_product=hypothetical protein / transcript_product=hypothetical protein / location=Cvel_scaffold1280:12539-15611(+) / protein_length=906 / sequence_SO=supercontig / SO=protein_coding / is_pseudo=false
MKAALVAGLLAAAFFAAAHGTVKRPVNDALGSREVFFLSPENAIIPMNLRQRRRRPRSLVTKCPRMMTHEEGQAMRVPDLEKVTKMAQGIGKKSEDMNVAIIGAQLSGLSLAFQLSRLHKASWESTPFRSFTVPSADAPINQGVDHGDVEALHTSSLGGVTDEDAQFAESVDGATVQRCRRLRVTIIDPNPPGEGGASSSSAGMVHPLGPSLRPLWGAARSLRLFRQQLAAAEEQRQKMRRYRGPHKRGPAGEKDGERQEVGVRTEEDDYESLLPLLSAERLLRPFRNDREVKNFRGAQESVAEIVREVMGEGRKRKKEFGCGEGKMKVDSGKANWMTLGRGREENAGVEVEKERRECNDSPLRSSEEMERLLLDLSQSQVLCDSARRNSVGEWGSQTKEDRSEIWNKSFPLGGVEVPLGMAVNTRDYLKCLWSAVKENFSVSSEEGSERKERRKGASEESRAEWAQKRVENEKDLVALQREAGGKFDAVVIAAGGGLSSFPSLHTELPIELHTLRALAYPNPPLPLPSPLSLPDSSSFSCPSTESESEPPLLARQSEESGKPGASVSCRDWKKASDEREEMEDGMFGEIESHNGTNSLDRSVHSLPSLGVQETKRWGQGKERERGKVQRRLCENFGEVPKLKNALLGGKWIVPFHLPRSSLRPIDGTRADNEREKWNADLEDSTHASLAKSGVSDSSKGSPEEECLPLPCDSLIPAVLCGSASSLLPLPAGHFAVKEDEERGRTRKAKADETFESLSTQLNELWPAFNSFASASSPLSPDTEAKQSLSFPPPLGYLEATRVSSFRSNNGKIPIGGKVPSRVGLGESLWMAGAMGARGTIWACLVGRELACALVRGDHEGMSVAEEIRRPLLTAEERIQMAKDGAKGRAMVVRARTERKRNRKRKI